MALFLKEFLKLFFQILFWTLPNLSQGQEEAFGTLRIVEDSFTKKKKQVLLKGQICQKPIGSVLSVKSIDAKPELLQLKAILFMKMESIITCLQKTIKK